MITFHWMLSVILLQTLVAAQAEQMLGFIIQPPVPAVVPLGSNASFQCTAIGDVFWAVNGGQVQIPSQVDSFAGSNIFVPLSTPSHSEVIITATVANNGSYVRCFVEEFGKLAVLNCSGNATLKVYGEPSPPTMLTLMLPVGGGLGVSLTWEPGFSLEGEEVSFVITSVELESGSATEDNTSASFIMLTPISVGGSCQQYMFIVHSENLFSRSASGINATTVVPTVPLSLRSDDVGVVQALGEDMTSALISFNGLSPCLEYIVGSYALTFTEIANDFGVGLASPFTIPHVGGEEAVSLNITSAEGLLSGRQYNVTIVAVNTAGSSSAVIMLSTTGLKSVTVETNSSSFTITCVFAVGATGLGCQASFESLLDVITIMRAVGSSVAMETVPLPEELTGNSFMVTVSEIVADGSVSSINVELMVNIISTTTQNIEVTTQSTPTSEFTSMHEPTETSTLATQFTTQVGGNSSFLSGSTLYIVIGVIAGVIVFLLLLITLIVICVIRGSSRRNKNLHSLELSTGEELKPNYVYGGFDSLPHVTTEFGGIENGRQVRSNTYDDLQHQANINGGATPMYETVQSAKKGMLSASGPPVLNPVYGPTGTPTSPLSPNPSAYSPSLVPNPVYSETGAHQFPEVSLLSPVYAAIGKSAPAPSGPAPSFYANAEKKMAEAACVPAPSINPYSDAMYEELHTTKMPDVDAMIKNESYGLLNTKDPIH